MDKKLNNISINYIVGENRNRVRMTTLEQLVAPNSRVRVIDLFVDILSINELELNMSNFNQKGHYRIILQHY